VGNCALDCGSRNQHADIIRIPGLAYDSNFTFWQLVMGYVWGGSFQLCAAAPVFCGELYTAYQLMSGRFGPQLRTLTGGGGHLFVTRAAAEGVRVYAVSIVVSIALGTGEDRIDCHHHTADVDLHI